MIIQNIYFLFSLFVILLISNGSCSCSSEEVPILNVCYSNYFREVETLSNTGYSKDYDIIQTHSFYIKDLLEKLNKLNPLCDIFMRLQECLGASVIKNCINADGFNKSFLTHWNETANPSEYYNNAMTSAYFTLNFACGDGNKAYKKTFECMKTLETSMKGYNCSSRGFNCTAITDYASCHGNYYKSVCGDDAYYYVYNKASIEVCYLRPKCNVCK